MRPPLNPKAPTGGREPLNRSAAVDAVGLHEIETSADIETTYSRHDVLGVWLPSKMTEHYVGPITIGARTPVRGAANTRAIYSDYKQFGTGARIKIAR